MNDKPNIVLLGVGHSGTRAFVRFLEALGWNLGDVKHGVAENRAVQNINKRVLAIDGICPCGSDATDVGDEHITCRRCGNATVFRPVDPGCEYQDALKTLPEPWGIKDPRLVVTWARWLPHFIEYSPVVLFVTRDMERMKKTYRKYKFPDLRIYGHSVSELVQIAKGHYEMYPAHLRLHVRYEELAAAVETFELKKAQ